MKIFALLFVLTLIWRIGDTKRRGSSNKGVCEVCKDFVKGFEEGLKNTEKNSFAGGDTSWEEENHKIYSKSEVRLVEVMEGICSGDDYQCSRLLERYEEDIERWWLKLKENGHPDLLQWLCYNHANVCCPRGTYGPDCRDCPGGRDNSCSGHGTCKGAENRDEVKGAGTCVCRSGYHGDLCELCKVGYYMDATKNCRKCNVACLDSCTGPGVANCTECAKGYKREEEGECEDIDECEDETANCRDGTYCENVPGSFNCENCNSACKHACTGSGPGDCVECATGYQKDDSGFCLDINECKEGGTAECPSGTWCDNSQGSYVCQQCHEVCVGDCTGPGTGGCTECKSGYSMENGGCEDIDECSSSPCNVESERCINEQGSFKCKCKAGYTRHQGKCTSWEEAERLRNQDNSKKTKKKKKSKSTAAAAAGTSSSSEQPAETTPTPQVLAQSTDKPTDSSIDGNYGEIPIVMTSSDPSMTMGEELINDSVYPAVTPSSTSSAHQEL